MNKRGFTLVELLATIIIIGLLLGIGTVAYTGIMNQVSNNAFERYMDSMHAEAIYYVTNNSDTIEWNSNIARIMLSDLSMDPINNPKNPDDKCINSYVDVTKTRNTISNVLSITYNVCLKCNDFDQCQAYEN